MTERYVCHLDLSFERDWNLVGRAPAFSSYNIAPDVEVPIIRRDAEGHREALMARWGLVPAEAQGHRERGMRIHVAAGRVADGLTAEIWRRGQRCILPMQGFYLWGEGEEAEPWYISLTRQRTFGVAGVWDVSTDTRSNLHLLSAAMLALPMSRETLDLEVSGSLPAILPVDSYDTWLGDDAEAAHALLRPMPAGELRAWRVGTDGEDLDREPRTEPERLPAG